MLVVAAVALSLAEGLGLGRSIIWAAVRAFAQLLVIGGGLTLVLAGDAGIVWSWL